MIYDVIVIGSGAGGSAVSYYLSQKGYKILLLEKGDYQKEGDYVQHIKTKQILLETKLSEEEKEEYSFLNKALDLSYVEEVGGTTPVSIGNACYSCSGCYSNSITTQFEKKDLNILKELLEVSGDLGVNYYPSRLWAEATQKIAKAGKELGYEIEPMPKFINFNKCINCGLCVNGCKVGAKWDATYFINEMKLSDNVDIIANFEVTDILYDNNKVRGVKGINKDNQNQIFNSKIVVISAGALNTPLILQKSGITDAGQHLFFDIFTTIGGYLKDINLKNELLMGIKAEFGPYFLSPHYSMQLKPLLLEKGYDLKDTDIVGLMLKFADTIEGKIHHDGSIEKRLTSNDITLIKEGYDKAVNILLKMGVKKESIVATSLKGAHPGGSAAVGEVVDTNFETKIKGLYLSDASVIPEAPGRPPILTITAISKKVSKIINEVLSNNR